MQEEPVLCEGCKIPMERHETQRCTVSYQWDTERKEYEETDKDWFGDCEIVYICPDCGGEVEG